MIYIPSYFEIYVSLKIATELEGICSQDRKEKENIMDSMYLCCMLC